MVDSWRELGRPEAARRRAASVSASPIVEPRAIRSSTESLPLAGEPQSVDQIVEVAVQHLGQVVHRVVHAVIDDALLREVVGPDLSRVIIGAPLRSALASTDGWLIG